eukprot:CAMPEP_0174700906 /NCGR_PEP_ID=MMETSP1094-20130205/5723_1 /TAXON_ID=156173 /ORGANISM="Chrysochromulina brevifilum, Strain UTEX LB 985" /LENGTH=54 /DNA_ID=CAMNT_0015898473 /DNA_START=127 /DNA_END=291 /DNA_ORIENTATION=-
MGRLLEAGRVPDGKVPRLDIQYNLLRLARQQQSSLSKLPQREVGHIGAAREGEV